MDPVAIAVAAAAGLALGLLAVVPVRVLPERIEERLEQPAWTLLASHPIVLAVVGALVGAACGARIGLEAELVPALLLVGLLLPVTAIDLAYRVIPNAVVLPGAAVGLVTWAVVDLDRLPEMVAAAALGFAVFFVLAVISPGGMGLGDVKLAFMLGAFLGWPVVVAVMASLLLSLVPSVVLLVRHGRAGGKVGLPFGPFLAAGAVVGLLAGEELLDAWLG